jgi:CDP-6-deoxy-D-xylo-4-hexulose-3-dehydrase
MRNNVTRADLDAVIAYLAQDDPPLTQSRQVAAFEREWSDWLGVRHSVFVNSGSSANLLSIAALRETHGAGGDVIVPTLTWVSDVAAVLQCGFTPVFVDVDPRTLGMDAGQVLERITPRTRAVFLTHVLGYNALTRPLLDELARRRIPLIEDVCESHGATFEGRKLGTFGLMSNFSFYYAHHMTSIEGGMISTDDAALYETLRMLRSHGMVREATSAAVREDWAARHPDLNPDFIFAFPAWNARSTEINAVIARAQLPRLDASNAIRGKNLRLFLDNLDPDRYFTDFDTNGSSNYAFTLILRHADETLAGHVTRTLRELGVEARRGTSGGGNQLRQPYLQRVLGDVDLSRFPRVDHVHFFGFYLGNYPDLEEAKIVTLCRVLNGLPTGPSTRGGA